MLYSVQLLRAIAAILVVICHATHKQGQLSGMGGSWEFGGSGVDLFFIISGFIMCHVTMHRNISVYEFLKARVLRIIPLYWLLSLVALAVYCVAPSLVNSSGGTTSVLDSFILFPTGDKFLIQTGWTLTYEFSFYLVFAASLSFAWRRRLPFICATLFAIVLGGFLFEPSNPTLKFLTSPLLLEFAMGIGAYLYVCAVSDASRLNVLLILIGAAALTYVAWVNLTEYRQLVYGVPFMLIFAGTVNAERAVRRLCAGFAGRVVTAIGAASYSLYLSHPFALSAASFLIKRYGVQHDPLVSIAIMVTTALLTGYACFVLVEVNLNRWVKSAFRKRDDKAAARSTDALETRETTWR
ncbi:acyltransferase family protein [Paraburkholderia sp. BCC1886]|uniref:acyltransferase family protein n=1 Tax=Paraburkholderia sp. BCC1886 TaxID=2562670 RepID=UPI001183BDCE|nr:acyltransferase [Paraburkholderia sp. BCC1886]